MQCVACCTLRPLRKPGGDTLLSVVKSLQLDLWTFLCFVKHEM